ncbi:MAG: methylenetetrahydrofolate--tRNA-(uracil(54)-C(5))-methyltransferase (FADH(2)-oxidizing) TrmFO [Deltaproteobacteria bacterium]|nr:methylenetetrahydrofolate--tRNA-(uracil(54)-C(5))-methyltransferase (FADH(2)-oxidizing) TrmFO [Deltaproteobacteria bacterium]
MVESEARDVPVTVIGGGLAGCEAAWQLLRRGHRVILREMKPDRFSPAHKSPHLAELVCSNSLRSAALENAVGLLKEEMRRMGSLLMAAADATSVPAGQALAVDRNAFSSFIEDRLSAQPGLEMVRGEVTEIPADEITIIASGPLTSDPLARAIAGRTGAEYLYFYDAISPIVEAESIDKRRVFAASRYGHGEADYLNCPMDREIYEAFWKNLTEAEQVPLHTFEEIRCFEGCLPIEVIARRGIDTLTHGPMKPVGLIDPRTGRQPHAVVQLRREDRDGILYNIVGFQTKMTWPEQRRLFRMIPGLEKIDFARYGSIHRNTFLNAPALLSNTLQLRSDPRLFFAGQISGVEGYVESGAMGLLAGLNAGCLLAGREMLPPPPETAFGALIRHITDSSHKTFQPMNVTFGLFPPLPGRIRKKERGACYARRSLDALASWQHSLPSMEPSTTARPLP